MSKIKTLYWSYSAWRDVLLPPRSARRRWVIIILLGISVWFFAILAIWLFVLPARERVVSNPLATELDGTAIGREQIPFLLEHVREESGFWSEAANWELRSRSERGLSFTKEYLVLGGLLERRRLLLIRAHGPHHLAVSIRTVHPL